MATNNPAVFNGNLTDIATLTVHVALSGVAQVQLGHGAFAAAAELPNRAPVAGPNAFTLTTSEDTPLTFTAAQFLANFTDPDGDALMLSVASPVVTNADGSFTFSPGHNFNGSTFSAGNFVVSDGRGGVVQQQVRLDVLPVNDAPHEVAPVGGLALVGNRLHALAAVLPAGEDDWLAVLGGLGGAGDNAVDLVRLNSDGTRDLAWAEGGRAVYEPSDIRIDGIRAASHLDGAVVVVGNHSNPSGTGTGMADFFAMRLLADGTPDSSFNAGLGRYMVDAGTLETIRALSTAGDGKITFAGWARPGAQYDTTVFRLHADGTPDVGFGTGGRVQLALSPTDDRADALAALANGSVVVVGRAQINGVFHASVLKLRADGSPDPSFGNAGSLLIAPPSGFSSLLGRTVLALDDGSLIVSAQGARVGTPAMSDFVLMRVHADGTQDMNFGTNGVVTVSANVASSSTLALSLVQRPDGKLLALLQATGADNPFRLAQFEAHGTPDSSFGDNGVLAPSDYTLQATYAPQLLADGSLLTAASIQGDGVNRVALARVRPDGSLDTSFSQAPAAAAPLSAGTTLVLSKAELLQRWIDWETPNSLRISNLSVSQGSASEDASGNWTLSVPADAGGELRVSYTVSDPDNASATGQRLFNIPARSLEGGASDDSLSGSTGDDTLSGLAGNDVLDGGEGNDTLQGGDGDDRHIGGPGNDLALGGAGDDRFVSELGSNDTFDGGDSIDRVEYWRVHTGPVLVNLGAGTGTKPDGSVDTLISISSAEGTAFADTLIGSSTADTFVGGPGDDSFEGLGGNDAIYLGGGETAVNVDLEAGTSSGAEGNDRYTSIEHVFASTHGDVLLGSSANNMFWPEAWDNSTNVPGGADTIDGRGGSDIVRYDREPAAVRVDMTLGAVLDGRGHSDRLISIENVFGSPHDDTFVGSAGAETLFGNAGHDVFILGHGGRDLVQGGDGNDRVELPLPRSSWVVRGLSATTTQLTSPDGRVVQILQVEHVRFSDATVAIELLRSEGNPTLNGSAGDDTLSGDARPEVINGVDGHDVLSGNAGDDSLDGGNGHDTLLGGGGSDTLVGGDGDDSMDAGAGSDFLSSGTGNDTIDGGVPMKVGSDYEANSVSYTSQAGVGLVVDLSTSGDDGSGWVSVSEPGGSGVDQLRYINSWSGTTAADSFTGSSAPWTESFSAGQGADTVDGGAMASEAFPSNSNRLFLQFSNPTPNWTADMATGMASSSVGTVSFSRINMLFGSNGNDWLLGSDEAVIVEQFEGSAGNDTIDGRGGWDLVTYEFAAQPVNVNLATGSAQDGRGGSDTLLNLEMARGSLSADVLTGDTRANRLEGYGGDDTLAPAGGDDTVLGGDGLDTLVLTGNRAEWDALSRNDDMLLTRGDDRVVFSAVEQLQFADGSVSFEAVLASASRWRVGGGGHDSLMGGGAGDTLLGGAGDDVLAGGAGSDRLEGSEGFDVADWRASTAAVNVDLRAGAATQGGDSDALISIEAVFGSQGADTLRGADGPDIQRNEALRGGAGNDSIDGGSGVDVAEFTGQRSGYEVLKTGQTRWTVRDLNPADGDEGIDTLVSIERIIFADQFLAFGPRAEELARVACVLWGPAVLTPGVFSALFARAFSFYDAGRDFNTLSRVALQFFGDKSDAELAEMLDAHSGSAKTAADFLATIQAATDSPTGRAAAVREAALDAATGAHIATSGVREVGITSDNFLPDFGQLFALVPG